MTEIEYRSFALRTADPEDEARRELVGLAVPYGEEYRVGDAFRESFDAGAFDDMSEGDVLPLFYAHGHQRGEAPIGVVFAGRNVDAGYEVRTRFSETPRGDEVYRLTRDGALSKFSVGFLPVETRTEDEDGVPHFIRTKATLVELSVEPFPAYAGAAISEVRGADRAQSKDSNVTEPISTATAADLEEVRGTVTDLERRMTMLDTGSREDSVVGAKFRTYGEYVKGVAAGDDDAVALFRAWTGGVLADSDIKGPAWVGDLIKLVERPRKLINAFQKAPDPGSNHFEYGVIEENTIEVAKQALEGDVLAYGKVEFGTRPGIMETLGGWTSMSRQQIERGDLPVVDFAFRALVRRYAQVTEAAFRARLFAAAAHEIEGADLSTATGVSDFVIDAAAYAEDEGYNVDMLVVSADVFKDLAGLQLGPNGPYLLDRTTGTVNVSGLSGSVFSIPLVVTRGTGVAMLADREAATSFESAGAPARLQDGDITNLTQAFSVYGYFGSAVQIPGALIVAGA